LISSEIAKGQQLEDLESPTATSVQSLLKSLTLEGGLRGRAAQSVAELERGGERSTAQPLPSRARARRPSAPQPAPVATSRVKERTAPTKTDIAQAQPQTQPQTQPTEVEHPPHPRFELQVGYSAPSCAPNGEVTCEGAEGITQEQAFNDFGVQYRLAQLASLSFATDLRYTTTELRSPTGPRVISTLSAGLATTYKTGLWYGRLQLGAGVQSGVFSANDVKLSYRGGALRFGGEGGMIVGSFSLSLYIQNESIPTETALCLGGQGQETCRTGWTPGVRQLGFRMGIVWGE